jgi:hypothetical protein
MEVTDAPVIPTAPMNRETWLEMLALLMAPRFTELGYSLPKFRLSIGFTSTGKDSNAIGECWHNAASADKTFEILIRPDQAKPMDVAQVLAHELIHAAVGFDQGHTGAFRKVALALGLKPPMTATTAGLAFIEWCQPLIDQLPPLPHAKLSWSGLGLVGGKKVPKDGPKVIPKGSDEWKSTGPKKQPSRLLKAHCTHSKLVGVNGEQEVCGYTVRVTKKWLEIGPPHCPLHGPMKVEEDEANAEPEGNPEDAE